MSNSQISQEDWFSFVIQPASLDAALPKTPEKQLLKFLRHFLEHSGQFDESSRPTESHQIEILLAMSMKIIAFLNYNLAKLVHKLPLYLMDHLMRALCNCCGLMDPYLPVEQDTCSPSARWIFQLYHRWALHCLVEESFVRRVTRSPIQDVAGITDKSDLHSDSNHVVLNRLQARADTSVALLQSQLGGRYDIARPTPACFQLPSLTSPDTLPDWTRSLKVPAVECAASLVAFELGKYFFMQRRFSQAFDCFSQTQTNEWIGQELTQEQLTSYLVAIRSISAHTDVKSDLMQRLESCRQNRYSGVTAVLLEDLAIHRVTGTEGLPDFVWDSIMFQTSGLLKDVELFELQTCYYLHCLRRGRPTFQDYPRQLQTRGAAACLPYLLKASLTLINTGFSEQIRHLFWYLCNYLSNDYGLSDVLLNTEPFSELFRSSDLSLTSCQDAQDIEELEEEDEDDFYDVTYVEEGDTCHDLRLLVTYSSEEICALLDKILAPGPGSFTPQMAANLSDRWSVALRMPVNSSDSCLVSILVSKAGILRTWSEFSLAKALLQLCVNTAGFSDNRLLRQQLLLVDICSSLETGLPHPAELVNPVEQLLTHEQNLSEDLVCSCVCLLLSAREKMPSLPGSSYCLELGRLFSTLTSDLSAGKTSSVTSDLWNKIGRFFPVNKRSASGGNTLEYSFARRRFKDFVTSVRNVPILDAIISGLVKMSALACDDINISVHCSSDPWPSQLPSVALHKSSLRESLRQVLEHATRFRPDNVSWLLTRADLALAEQHFLPALKFYIEAAIASSEFFEKPLPMTVFTTEVVRRMIRSCERFGLCGCAGVLAQLISDHSTAVRLLTDANSSDFLDALIPFLWDLNLLEILTSHSYRRGAVGLQEKLTRAIGAPELNSCNRPDLLHEVESSKKSDFFRNLASLVFVT